MKNNSLTKDFNQNIKLIDSILDYSKNFDIITKDFSIGGKSARLYVINGFAKSSTILDMIIPSLRLKPENMETFKTIKEYSDKYIGYIDSQPTKDPDKICSSILSGPMAFLMEGFDEALIIDTREYPARSINEPDSNKALRGARDGFCETLVFNTALIRRNIRSPLLATENFTVGKVSKTDVVMCYLKGRCDQKQVEKLRYKIKHLDINSLTMKQESLSEAMIKKAWYNPFPKTRYTERPDCAAAAINEGGIVIVVDGTPAVMLLPTAFIDFFQDANDYYFPPLVGSYLRIVRFIICTLTLFLIPTWYLLILNPPYIPSWISFVKVAEMNDVPIFFQLMLVELVIDCLKQASLNTPSSLGGSFSVVSALILGDFAVKAKWFVPEVLLYMAFVAVANFAQPSYELGYAVKLCRMLLIILTAVLNIWGFVIGIFIILFLISTNSTLTGQSYLYPLYPFNGKKLKRVLLRTKMNNENS